MRGSPVSNSFGSAQVVSILGHRALIFPSSHPFRRVHIDILMQQSYTTGLEEYRRRTRLPPTVQGKRSSECHVPPRYPAFSSRGHHFISHHDPPLPQPTGPCGEIQPSFTCRFIGLDSSAANVSRKLAEVSSDVAFEISLLMLPASQHRRHGRPCSF